MSQDWWNRQLPQFGTIFRLRNRRKTQVIHDQSPYSAGKSSTNPGFGWISDDILFCQFRFPFWGYSTAVQGVNWKAWKRPKERTVFEGTSWCLGDIFRIQAILLHINAYYVSTNNQWMYNKWIYIYTVYIYIYTCNYIRFIYIYTYVINMYTDYIYIHIHVTYIYIYIYI